MISFDDINGAASPYTLLTHDRKVALYRVLRSLSDCGVTGAAAELGVYRGGTAMIIAAGLADRPLYLFDTFTGIPSKSEFDTHNPGDFGDTSLAAVEHLLSGFGERVHFCPGLFPVTASLVPGGEVFAFAHCDADQYQSTKDFLDFFYPRMTPGGVMVFDDYLWGPCPGVELALKEFIPDKPEVIDSFTACQAMIFKL